MLLPTNNKGQLLFSILDFFATFLIRFFVNFLKQESILNIKNRKIYERYDNTNTINLPTEILYIEYPTKIPKIMYHLIIPLLTPKAKIEINIADIKK